MGSTEESQALTRQASLPAAARTESVGDDKEIVYYVKWQGKSHLHNTWLSETEIDSMDLKGKKKLKNYQQAQKAIEARNAYLTPEEIEYHNGAKEQQKSILLSHKTVERIVAARQDPETGNQQYFCKWEGLPYAQATWEDTGLIAKFAHKIDEYLRHNSSNTIPIFRAQALISRPAFIHMVDQPTWIPPHLKLRDYQLDGVNWLASSWCRQLSVILADEMGLGKTIQTLTYLSYLHNNYKVYGPFLLVVPLSTLMAWQRESAIWASNMNAIVYLGDSKSREIIREMEFFLEGSARKVKFNILITTYETILSDWQFLSEIHWAELIVDEAQRLKNDESALYTKLITFRTDHRILVTGTPLQV